MTRTRRPSAAPGRIPRSRRPRAARFAGALLATLVAAAGLTGCGYGLVGQGTNIPEEVREIYLSPIENRTQRQRLDQIVTEAVAQELSKRRRFSLTSDRDGADAELSGAVVGFGLTPISFDDQGRADEYEISVTAQVVFERLPGGEVLWQADHYQFRQTYAVDITEAGFLDREEEAIREATDRFAETLVSDLLTGF
ncbi:MAG: LPS assembly lipoprotein LptE [Thermoanaerobaculia bacterium]